MESDLRVKRKPSKFYFNRNNPGKAPKTQRIVFNVKKAGRGFLYSDSFTKHVLNEEMLHVFICSHAMNIFQMVKIHSNESTLLP